MKNDLTETLPPRESYNPLISQHWLEVGIITGAALLIILCAALWAKYFRRPARRRHTRSQAIMGAPEPGASPPHRHHRHRGERYTRRNPTLAETGGLPPVRPDFDTPSPPPAGSLPS